MLAKLGLEMQVNLDLEAMRLEAGMSQIDEIKTNVNLSEVDQPKFASLTMSNDPQSPALSREQSGLGSFFKSSFKLPRLILANQSSISQFVFEEDTSVQQF